jgi:hypothetical protein
VEVLPRLLETLRKQQLQPTTLRAAFS